MQQQPTDTTGYKTVPHKKRKNNSESQFKQQNDSKDQEKAAILTRNRFSALSDEFDTDTPSIKNKNITVKQTLPSLVAANQPDQLQFRP